MQRFVCCVFTLAIFAATYADEGEIIVLFILNIAQNYSSTKVISYWDKEMEKWIAN